MGVRVREAPMTPAGGRAVLKAAGARFHRPHAWPGARGAGCRHDQPVTSDPGAGTLVLRPSRSGIYASALAALLFGSIGIGMVVSGRLIWLIALAIGAVGLFAFLAGVWPGRAFLRLDPQGFYVKAPTKSWGAAWYEVERFRIEARVVGRNGATMDVVRADYRDGYEARRTPGSRLGEALGVDERYVMPGYGGLSAAQLVELLEQWRAATAGRSQPDPGGRR
jgi:hypothetical protein